jgi:hypothetical protein
VVCAVKQGVNVFSLVTSGFARQGAPNPYSSFYPAMTTVTGYTNDMAQFIYQAVLLFALNIAITAGLSMSLYKALKSGLGESGRFW